MVGKYAPPRGTVSSKSNPVQMTRPHATIPEWLKKVLRSGLEFTSKERMLQS
jgi:hypothetical protein